MTGIPGKIGFKIEEWKISKPPEIIAFQDERRIGPWSGSWCAVRMHCIIIVSREHTLSTDFVIAFGGIVSIHIEPLICIYYVIM